MNLLPMLAATGGGSAPTYVDDVFGTYTYTGNGTTQTITNGIDLATNGGMVWTKERTNNGSAHFPTIADTIQGYGRWLFTSNTNGQGSDGTKCISNFSTTGYTLSDNAAGDYCVNGSTGTQNYVGWTFRKAAKFFDMQTWTGNGANRTIAHSLGAVPGMIWVKRTDISADWQVYHRSLANTEYLVLNGAPGKATGATRWNSTTPTSSVFSLGTDTTVNASGGTYIAYLFAHDATADGLIQCADISLTTGVDTTVTLGWEPQWIMVKQSNGSSGWYIHDAMRGLNDTQKIYVTAESSGQETSQAGTYTIVPTATGFIVRQAYGIGTSSHICIAIRRPNKPPTVGTQVYQAIARTVSASDATLTGVGFSPDTLLPKPRVSATGRGAFVDRLRGIACSLPFDTSAEKTNSNGVMAIGMDGATFRGNAATNDSAFGYDAGGEIDYFFKRAPGVFDVVCYTGTGTTGNFSHGLGVTPELLIVKNRTNTYEWMVWSTTTGNSNYLFLNATDAVAAGSYWNSGHTASYFGVLGNLRTNGASNNYVAYLFATKAGISKVGSYTGNGSNQTINCGFTTGARFILIKRTDSTGDWFVWDTTRGIVAGNDPHLSLNSAAAEITTDDSIDPDTSGFVVNQVSGVDVNVTSATYIFLAIA